MQTATITIGGRTWQIQVATTSSEFAQGLRGVSLSPLNGMLFDLGYERSSVTITMTGVLIPLALVFLSNDLRIVGLGELVQNSGDTTIPFPTGQQPRYFLEINANEFSLVNWGDAVSITGYTPPTPSTPVNLSGVMQTALGGMVMIMVVGVMMKQMKSEGSIPERKIMKPGAA